MIQYKFVFLVLAAFCLSSCARTSSYSNACFETNKNFDLAVECTKTKMGEDPKLHIPAYRSFKNVFIPYMDSVSKMVKAGKITPEEGRSLIAEKINQLEFEKELKDNSAQKLKILKRDEFSNGGKVYDEDECTHL